MPRRQIPRHKKRASAKRHGSKPAAAQALPATPAAPIPQPAPPADPDQDPEALRANVRLLAAQIGEGETRLLRRLLRGWSALQSLVGESIEGSLLRMLRAQIFTFGEQRCGRRDVVQIRQRRLGDPLDPVAQPRSHLMCPLHEAALDGRLSPCPSYYDSSLKDEGIASILRAGKQAAGQAVSRASLRSMFDLLGDNDREPCNTITQDRSVHQIIFGPLGYHVSAAQDPGELLGRRERLLAADQAHLSGDDLRAQLRFLHDSGRLDDNEVTILLDNGLYTTDRGWLSCRDDEERTRFPGEDDCDSNDTVCPLQHRALLGDRTVPCAQALEQEPDSALIEEARAAPPPQYRPRGEPPRSWGAPEEEPGQEGDIVRRLRILPCHVVGRLLALELPATMARLRDEDEPERKETSANAAVEADWEG